MSRLLFICCDPLLEDFLFIVLFVWLFITYMLVRVSWVWPSMSPPNIDAVYMLSC